MVKSQKGQALLEFLLVLIFSVFVMVKAVQAVSEFMDDSIGNLGHVLSVNLKVGVCNKFCYFSGYKNGFGQ